MVKEFEFKVGVAPTFRQSDFVFETETAGTSRDSGFEEFVALQIPLVKVMAVNSRVLDLVNCSKVVGSI